MKLFILLILSIVLNAKTMELVAKIEYTNTSEYDIKHVKHMLTIPENRYYQTLKDIYILPDTKYIKKKRKKYDVEYISINFGTIKKHQTISKEVHFIIDMKNLETNFSKDIQRSDFHGDKFLRYTKELETNSKQIKAISYLININNISLENKLKLAFEFPAKYLDYKVQKKTSALTALKTGVGDCTEYSMLFISLARGLGFETRKAAVFNFTSRTKFNVPNHHISEIYTQKYGWMPIYPNLSLGGNKDKYKLGKIANTIIFFKHNSWTWARSFKNKKNKKINSLLKTKIAWEIK